MGDLTAREAGMVIAAARSRQGVSVERLSVRARIPAERLAHLEAGEERPRAGELDAILRVLGEELSPDGAAVRPLRRDYDRDDLRAALARTPSQRLADAMAANRFADELARAGELARASGAGSA